MMKKTVAAVFLLMTLLLCACSARPKNLPTEIPTNIMPFISGLQVVADSYELTTLASGGKNMAISFSVNRPYEEVVAYYNDKLEGRYNYETQTLGNYGTLYYYNQDNYLVGVVIMADTPQVTKLGLEVTEYVL